MVTEKQLANLKAGADTQFKTGEQQVATARKGGIASQQKRKEQKTLAQYMMMWLNSSLTKADKDKLEQMGLQGVDEKKALLVLPLIKNLNKGDVKSYELVMKLIGEDKKREQEIEKLKLENDLLRQQLSGEGIDKVEIILDLPKVE